MSDELLELSETFRHLGANDPKSWAKSQIEEGIPQLHRFLFLRAAWSGVVADGTTSWIDKELKRAPDPDAPGASLGPALTRLLQAGAKREDISEVVRVMQWQLLFHLCCLVDGDVMDPAPDIDDLDLSEIRWGLFTLDDDDNPGESMGGLHESVLETDPSGREMRPRDAK